MLPLKETTTEVLAPAKVNVTLVVAGRRADGFHDVATIMAPLALADLLTITTKPGTGVNVTCDDAHVPADRRNLAARAALSFLAATKLDARVDITVEKRVPVGAGLGGGSSDAAATLATLNAVLDTPLNADALGRLARTLGSDVPFFLVGGWALATGRGDFVTPVRGPSRVPFLVAAPRRGVPTARVYAALTEADYAAGANPIWNVLAALDDPIDVWWPLGTNSLEGAARLVFRELNELHRVLTDLGFGFARLSGSGGAFVAPVAAEDAAQETARELVARGFWATATTTL